MVYRWLFISFHTGGLTSGDPSADQSAESRDPHLFATVLISFDGARLQVDAVKWSPAASWLKEEGARPTHSVPTISSHRMSNTLNLMYQQILLNYSDACTHAYMFMCVSGGSKWCSYVSVCSAVWAHSSMLVFTYKKGARWVVGGSEVTGMSTWAAFTHPTTCCTETRELPLN